MLFPFPVAYFSVGLFDRVKGCVVSADSRRQAVDRGRNCVVGPSIVGIFNGSPSWGWIIYEGSSPSEFFQTKNRTHSNTSLDFTFCA